MALSRCIPQILRSFGGNRMLSSGVSVRRREAPWLVLAPNYQEYGSMLFKFYSCTDRTLFNHFHGDYLHGPIEYRRPGWKRGLYINSILRMEMVGSSHGWIALYGSKKSEAWLFDPTTFAQVKLPGLESLGVVCSVILSERQGGKAFMIFGASRRLAFCWPHHEWRMFGEEGGYESVVYSSTRRRLLCLTSTMKLEAWDVDSEAPRLASVTSFEFELPELELEQQLKYIAEDEESGELYLVVRRVKIGGAVGFEVYKIEGNELIHMDRGLDGVVMFVGVNNPIVLRDGDGLKPNSIYFAYDNRVRPGGADLGIYDYATASVSPITQHASQLEVPPVWLTPPSYYMH